MALNKLPTKGKLLEVQDGTKYAYVYVVAKDSKPTFLLLHGFPSSSYDWRHQLKSLTELGYGVLAPDLLGYGDTDRPVEIEKYKFKKMTADLVQILEKVSLKTVIGVAHDW
jgi:pimeloyl-ACP methyl ester carboxylesterase